MFGTTQSSFGTPGGNAFGKPTGGGLFGNSSNTASTGNSLFGGNNNTGSSTTGGGLFGNNAGSNNSNNSSGGLFGNTGGNNAASTGTSLFGNSNNNNNNNASSGGLFGNNNNNNNNTAAPTGGLFGNNNNNNTTAPTGGLFGNNNNNNTAAPTGGLFGNSNNNTAAPTGGLFGNNNNSTGGGFANKPSTPTTGGGLFGNNNSAATSSSGGLFGSNTTNTASTGGLFGNTANNTATNTGSLLFGTKNSTTSSGGLFGNTTTAAPTNAGLFGNTQSAPKGGLFGNTVSTPSTGGLFGNNAITNNNINLSNAQLGNVVPSANTNSSDMLPLSNITHLPALTPAKKFPLRNGTANSVIKSSFSRVSKPRTFQKFSNQSYSLHNSETPSYINDTKDLFLKSVVSNQPAKPLFTSSLISDSRRSDVKKLIIAKRTISSDEIRGIKRDQSENALPSTISSPSITNTPVSSSKSSFSPFPSHGGPISPQFKRVYEINKTALDEGYWIYPPLKELFSYGFDQLANVTDLSIGRKNHGKIQYTVPVDLSEIRNLGDIMGNLVVFDGTTVCVYPDDSKKAPAGTALNMPAVVTLENVFIKHPVGSKIVTVTDPINPKAIKQTQLLRKKVEEQGGEFITYDVTHGIFVFKVSHFSTWGFSEIDLVYDDEEDAEMDLDEPDTQPIEAEDMDEDEDEALVHKASIFKQFPDEQGLIIAEPDTTISDEIAFSEVARSDNWLEQLEYAGDFTSSFAQLHERNTKELTGADLDDTIFGGIDTLTANSTTVQYAEAAEKLRLPSAFSPHTVAKFTFNNDLLVKHRDSPSGFDIAPSYLENNIDSSEKELWSLASVLFDPISLLGLEPIPDGYSESTEIRIVSQYRTKLLSKWLKRNVASDIEKQIAKSSSSLLKPFIYLTGNRITKAALAATQSKNPHLAALISLLGTDDTNIRKVAKAQLENWSQTGSAAFVPREIQNVYELLAGNANVKTGVDLTWLQVFGLHLWYDSTVNESIDEAVKRYAPASKNFTTSIEFELLKLVDSNNSPVNVLNFRNAWVSWALYIVLYKSLSLYNDEREVFGDQISLNFALELEKAGNVVEAAFVICHISRDDLVQRYLQDLVSRQVDLLTQDVITKLVSVLHVPEKIIREAVALKHRAKTDHVNECLALIDANDWTEAHKVLSHYVAPQCVISNDITTLYNILIKFSTNDANNVSSKVWANGGQVYLDYVLLYERIEPDQAKLSNEDSTESFGKLAERFRRGLAAWQPNADDNFKVGVSRTLLESFSRRYIENRE